jgi:hypothetical protein
MRNEILPWRIRLKVAAFSLAPTVLHRWLGVSVSRHYWRDGISIAWSPRKSETPEDMSAYPQEWLAPSERADLNSRAPRVDSASGRYSVFEEE